MGGSEAGIGPATVLLIGDEEDTAARVVRALASAAPHLAVTCAGSLREAWAWLDAGAGDAALLIVAESGRTGPATVGLETVGQLRAAAPSLPLVVLAGDDEGFALAALAAGAQDCLALEPADGARVWRAMRHAMVRKRLEEDLRLSEERLQGIIGLAQDAILTTDETLNITLFNQAAAALFGYEAAEIVGRPLALLIPERVRADHAARVAEFRDSPVQSRVMANRREVVGLTRDGREFPAEVSIAKLHHARGLLYTAVIRDASERKRVETELRRMATTDPLTGLCNRRHFMDLAETEMARLRRHGRPLSVLMLDVDRFKGINDTHGHATGDQALCRLAAVCRTELRDTDHIGRLGGEEFAVILPETGIDAARDVAERLRRRLSAVDIPHPGGVLRMTVSIGVALCGEDEPTIERAMGRADRALYAAKAHGRDRVEVCEWAHAPSPLAG